MPTYEYTGTLTDVGLEVLTDRLPRLRVRPERRAWGPDGPVSEIPREVDIDPATGEFSMHLLASADLTPNVRYVLDLAVFVSSIDDYVAIGYDAWTFTAAVGGGNVAGMADAPPTKLFIGPPWPAVPLPGAYFDTTTNDIGYYDLEI